MVYIITHVNLCSSLSTWDYLFEAYYLRHYLNSKWRFGIIKLLRHIPWCNFNLITVFYSFCSWLMYDAVIMYTCAVILYIMWRHNKLTHITKFIYFSQKISMIKYCGWGILLIFRRNYGMYHIFTLLVKIIYIYIYIYIFMI